MHNAAYLLTRRYGRRTTLCVVSATTTNAETGARTVNETTLNLRRVIMEATKYSRLIRAKASDQDCGETSFIIWTNDVPGIERLDPESYLIRGDKRYSVITCGVEDDALVITAREIVGATGKQEISVDASNSLGVSGEVEQA